MTQASSEQTTIWLTQEAFDKLQAELENLRGPVRAEIVARISAARDEGDLKENGGYHAAREEQGKTEARIRQLEDMLRRAEVGETPADDGVVEPGMKVTYKFVGDDDETETFLLGAREMEDATADIKVYSPQSPARLGDHRQARRATRSPTRRPTASSSRSRSSTRCPTPAEPDAPRRAGRTVGYCVTGVAAVRAGGASTRSACSAPRVSTWSCTSTSSRCRLAEVRSCTTSRTLA